jgi:hypothetical protein
MDELKPSGKPFEITKWEVWEAYRQVKANRGAPGVDGVTLEEFDKDLKNTARVGQRRRQRSAARQYGADAVVTDTGQKEIVRNRLRGGSLADEWA